MKPKHKHHVFLGASIPHDTFEELDEHRGEVPRSVIVNHALQLYLAHVKGKEDNNNQNGPQGASSMKIPTNKEARLADDVVATNTPDQEGDGSLNG